MSVVDLESIKSELGDLSAISGSRPIKTCIDRSQIRIDCSNEPDTDFSWMCVRGTKLATSKMHIAREEEKFIDLTLLCLSLEEPRVGDKSRTLPDLRREAIRYGTSIALELLRRESLRMNVSGQSFQKSQRIALNIANRLNVSDHDRKKLRHEMELELRLENKRSERIIEKNQLAMSRLDNLFLEQVTS